mmetsp:Transcript_10439/g.28397  ORF Transcript_10439/g.28397 Transcript_10439/m.28397 type:complete len:251 (-) Transcript_10439:21-773(-)
MSSAAAASRAPSSPMHGSSAVLPGTAARAGQETSRFQTFASLMLPRKVWLLNWKWPPRYMRGLSMVRGARPSTFSPASTPSLNTFMCPESETVHSIVNSFPSSKKLSTRRLIGFLPRKTVKCRLRVRSMAPAVMLSSSAWREKSNTRVQLSMPSIVSVHMNEKAPPSRPTKCGDRLTVFLPVSGFGYSTTGPAASPQGAAGGRGVGASATGAGASTGASTARIGGAGPADKSAIAEVGAAVCYGSDAITG